MQANPGQVRFVGAQVAAGVLEAATMPGHQETLERAVRAWFPDTSTVDALEIRRIANLVRLELQQTRSALLGRADRWVSEGKAQAL